MEQKKKNEKDVLVVRDEKTGEISVVAGLDSKGLNTSDRRRKRWPVGRLRKRRRRKEKMPRRRLWNSRLRRRRKKRMLTKIVYNKKQMRQWKK